MPRRPMLFPHLSEEALRLNYRQCKDSADRTRWQALWLLAQGSGAKTQREVGQLLDRSHTWVGRLVGRYIATLTDPGPFPPKNELESRRAVRPLRWMPRAWLRWTMHLNTKVRPVGDFVLAQLQHCLGQSGTYRACPPTGLGRWSGVKVTLWILQRTGIKPHRVTGWHYLCKLGYSEQIPRPSHPQAASKAEQVAFKKKS